MINRVVLIGRLTRDVEVRKTPTGLSVASFTVACNRPGSRDQQQSADFISCTAWRQTADFLGNYARKGALVGVEGRISTRNYDDKDGKRVYVTEVVCDSVQLLESKAQSQSRPTQAPSNSYTQPMNADPFGSDMSVGMESDDFNMGPSLDISSDDLPF